MSHVESWHATRRSRPSFQLAISRAEFKSYGRPPMPGETGRHEPCGRQLRLESNILNCLRTAMRTATAKCTESNARKRLGCATCVSEQFEVGMKWPRKKHSSQLLSGCATHEAGSSQQCVDARHGVFLPTLHTSLGIRLGFWPRLCLRSGLCTFLMNPKVQVVPTFGTPRKLATHPLDPTAPLCCKQANEAPHGEQHQEWYFTTLQMAKATKGGPQA